jgi:hypothetical protein
MNSDVQPQLSCFLRSTGCSSSPAGPSHHSDVYCGYRHLDKKRALMVCSDGMAGSDLDAEQPWQMMRFAQRFAAAGQHDFENGEARAEHRPLPNRFWNKEWTSPFEQYTMQKSDDIQGSAAEQIWNTRWNRIHSKTTTQKSEHIWNYTSLLQKYIIQLCICFCFLFVDEGISLCFTRWTSNIPAQTSKVHCITLQAHAHLTLDAASPGQTGGTSDRLRLRTTDQMMIG